MLAELHGKLSANGSFTDRLEDQLTGDIFGALRYLPFELGMGPLLSASSLPALRAYLERHGPQGYWADRFYFWPRHPLGELDALLEYVSPKATEDNGVIMFEVKAAVKIPENVFVRAGYSANASIVIQSREGVLTLPESTVEFEGDKTYVYLLTSADGAEEQTFDKHEVKIGLSDGINIELTEGVTAESKVRGAREEKKK